MTTEGNSQDVYDLKPIRSKKLNLKYYRSDHRISLRGRKNSRVVKFIIGLSIIALAIIVFNTTAFKELMILYKIRNKDILIGFQNSAELRPTGGFWGSFGILKVNSDFSSNLRFDTNPYKKDNLVFKNSTVPLPKPLQETWPDRNQSFVNANYNIDFPQTAKSLQWFLSEGWGEKTDGVIAISSLSIIDLLKITGPVVVDNTEINSENFTNILSDKIDRDYWLSEENKTINEPKTILKDLSPILIEKSKNIGKVRLYKFLSSQINEGRILAYFNDSKIQKLSNQIGSSGEILSNGMDYLNINNANLNGGKSSLNVIQVIRYNINESSTSSHPQSNLSITRSQNNSWPNILNRNYTRVLVPLGSKLLSAKLDDEDITESVEVGEEAGKTYFGFWFSVGPGEAKTATLDYENSFENSNFSNYNLVWQKQPGTLQDTIEIKAADKTLYSGKFVKNYLKVAM